MNEALFYPMAAQAFLIFAVVILLAKRRFTAIARKESDLKYFKFFQGSGEPEHVTAAQRNMINQFEMPVLFFFGCLAATVFGRVDEVLWGASWVYVGLRALHVLVHTGSNNVKLRALVWMLSNFALLFFWVWMVL